METGSSARFKELWSKHKLQLTRGIPQGPILGPTLFNSFTNDLDDGTECIPWQGQEIEEKGLIHQMFFAAIHRNLDKMEKGANRNLMIFNKEKWKVLHWGGVTPGSTTSYRTTVRKTTSQKKSSGSSKRTVWTWASNVFLQQRKITASWAVLGRALPAVWGRWSFPSELVRHLARPVLGYPLQQKHAHPGASLVKGHKHD